MTTYIYIDSTDAFVEGQRLAAVKAGMAFDIHEATRREIFDFGYTLDFNNLAALLGDNDAKVFETRNSDMQREASDVGILVPEVMVDALTRLDKTADKIVLVGGDAYELLVHRLAELGFTVDVAFWSHAAGALKPICANFIELDSHFDQLALDAVAA